MIDFSAHFQPESPQPVEWRFRYRHGERGLNVEVVSVLYKTRRDGDRVWIDLEQQDGSPIVGLLERMALAAGNLEIHQIRLPEQSWVIDPPLVITPDPKATDTVDRMLPDVVLAAYCEPPHKGVARKHLDPRPGRNELHVHYETISQVGGASGSDCSLRFRRSEGLVLMGHRWVGMYHIAKRHDTVTAPPGERYATYDEMLDYLGMLSSGQRTFASGGRSTSMTLQVNGNTVHLDAPGMELVPRSLIRHDHKDELYLNAAEGWTNPLDVSPPWKIIDQRVELANVESERYSRSDPPPPWPPGGAFSIETAFVQSVDWATQGKTEFENTLCWVLAVHAEGPSVTRRSLEQVLVLDEDFGIVRVATRHEGGTVEYWDAQI